MALNLTNGRDIAPTPFSIQEVQRYTDFFNFSPPCDDDFITRAIIVTVIMANYYNHQSNAHLVNPPLKVMSPFKTIILKVICCGMPPNYQRRFDTASSMYRQLPQPEIWESFLEQVRQERGAASVVSSLLLTYVRRSLPS